jgi:glycosyltransferase involved in cell wall biosynthesis
LKLKGYIHIEDICLSCFWQAHIFVPPNFKELSTIEILCVVVVGIQVFYLLLLLFSFSKKSSREGIESVPVSVIICSHDEENNLKELIPALLQQQYEKFEVIVVDDRSNDGTYDYLLDAIQKDSRLKMVRVSEKPEHIHGKKFALTLGIKASKFDWILLIDADCLPASSHWISEMMKVESNQTQIILGFSPYKREKGFLNSFIRFESLLTGIQFIGFALLGKPYMGVGRNMAYKKELFLNSKGFNNYQDVVGGDDDLFINAHSTKINTQVRMGEAIITVSKAKNNWTDFLHQKLRHLSAGRKYKFSDRVMLGGFMGTWLLTWFGVLPIALFSDWIFLIVGLFVIRMVMLNLLVNRASKALGAEFESWKTSFLDFIFSFYYLVTGLRALVVKRIKWKN